MALTTKNMFRYVAGLIVLVAACGAWIAGNLPITDRDLTDAELAGTYGRQPDPIIVGKAKCDPCKLVESVNACKGKNPCWVCVTDGEESCGDVSYWKFSNDNVGKTPTYVAGQPDKLFVNLQEFCNGEYYCITVSQADYAICTSLGCADDLNRDCNWCDKGAVKETVVNKPVGRCDNCPP